MNSIIELIEDLYVSACDRYSKLNRKLIRMQQAGVQIPSCLTVELDWLRGRRDAAYDIWFITSEEAAHYDQVVDPKDVDMEDFYKSEYLSQKELAHTAVHEANAAYEETKAAEAKIETVWSLIDTDVHSHYVASMLIAEALGGTLVNGKWKKP